MKISPDPWRFIKRNILRAQHPSYWRQAQRNRSPATPYLTLMDRVGIPPSLAVPGGFAGLETTPRARSEKEVVYMEPKIVPDTQAGHLGKEHFKSIFEIRLYKEKLWESSGELFGTWRLFSDEVLIEKILGLELSPKNFFQILWLRGPK